MTVYAEVSFPDPIGDGTLTYHLAAGRDIPAIGSRVVVPVQNRRLIGYITAIHEVEPPFKTVALGEVIDPLPLISTAMMQLAQATASDCVCNIGEVLHSMLPGGIKQSITRLVRCSPDCNESNEALNWLRENEWVSHTSFAARFKLSAAIADSGNKPTLYLSKLMASSFFRFLSNILLMEI